MRTMILAATALAALGGGGALMAGGAAHGADRHLSDAQKFDRDLAGLTPGATSDCLPVRGEQASLKAYGPRLVYKVSNRLSYVTDTGGGCEGVARDDILVTRSTFGRLCRGDIASTVDSASRMPTGSCAIGSFTAWRR